jgi:hypothetical protein
MSRAGRRLLAVFTGAHGLSRGERKLCRRLADRYGLDGRGGPETSPAMLFFRPSFWEVFSRDAREDGSRKLKAEEIERLRAKLF